MTTAKFGNSGSVPIGSAVMMGSSVPIDVTIKGERYLRSGNIELDTNTFDISIHSQKTFRELAVHADVFAGNGYTITGGRGITIAAGANGSMATSPDNETWTARTSGFGVTSDIWRVYDGGDLYVAVGESGKITTSTDGITWTARTSGTAQALRDVVRSGGLYVAVGLSGAVTTSPDGITWTAQSPITSQTLYGVIHDGSKFVAFGNANEIFTSAIGTGSWTEVVNDFPVAAIFSMLFDGTNYVGTSSSAIAKSLDLETWESIPTSDAAGSIWSIAFGDGSYVCSGQIDAVFASSDLTLFQKFPVDTAFDTIYNVNYFDGFFWYVGSSTADIGKGEYIYAAGSAEAYAEGDSNQYVRIS